MKSWLHLSGATGLVLLVSGALGYAGAAGTLRYESRGGVSCELTPAEERRLDAIQQRTFQFFLNERHAQWGLVKDRSTASSPASIAATGFGLACYGIGAERKWVSREQAARMTLETLDFFYHSSQGRAADVTGYKGFYYHFLSMESGRRVWQCELSSVDTGLLMMGVLFARNYFSRDNDIENQVRLRAGELLGRLDWGFLLMPSKGEYAHTISMGWTPEKGMHAMGWNGYNEALFLYILAAGTGMTNAEQGYQAWLRTYQWQTPYPGLSHVAFPPLFGHQFSHAFIDFRGLADPYLKQKGIDYFENSRRATEAQRQYAITNPHKWVGYGALCWGVTACDGPTESCNVGDKKFLGYAGRGATGPDFNYFDDGTIAPCAALASLPFAPRTVLPTISFFMEKYGDRLWGKYGFYDAFNPTANWFDSDYLGIDQGPILIMVENFRTGLVWKHVMKDPVIQKGLGRLGFEYLLGPPRGKGGLAEANSGPAEDPSVKPGPTHE